MRTYPKDLVCVCKAKGVLNSGIFAYDGFDDAADGEGAFGTDALIGFVGGVEVDALFVFAEVFHGPFAVDLSDDNVIFFGWVAFFDEDDIAGVDAGFDHGVSADGE